MLANNSLKQGKQVSALLLDINKNVLISNDLSKLLRSRVYVSEEMMGSYIYLNLELFRSNFSR